MRLQLLESILGQYYINIGVIAGIYVILALGLNLITGYCGQVSLGHAAFYGIGAYASALLSTKLGVPFWISLPVSAGLTFVVGLVFGLPTLRVHEDFLAILTLGLGLVVQSLLINLPVTGRTLGLGGIPRPSIFGHSLDNDGFLLLVWLFVLIAILVEYRLVNSKVGRAWKSIRYDEIAAEALGIDCTRFKVLAFAIGAAYGGVGGSLFAHFTTFISPDSFGVSESITILSMIVFGGMGTVFGVVIGSIVLAVVPEVLRFMQDYRMLLYGMLLVLMMRYCPQGVFVRVSLRRLTPRLHGAGKVLRRVARGDSRGTITNFRDQ